jgi:hypothetical protein
MSNTSKKTVARSAEAPARRVRRASAPAPLAGDDQIAALAYHYFEQSGCVHGHDLEHWLRAESELRGR